MTPDEYLKRLSRAVLVATKTAMERAPVEISAFTGEHLQDPGKKDGLVKSKKGNLYYKLPNKTNQLRTLYGNIQRAITPDEEGNISEVFNEGGTFIVSFGIDGDARVKAGKNTTSLAYALKHEKTRPYLSLGMKDYMSDPQGFKALIKELETDILDAL